MRRFAEIRGWSDALLVLRIALLGASIPLLMRLPLERLRSIIEARPSPPLAPHQFEREAHVLALIDVTLHLLRPVLRPNCLTFGITRYFFLRGLGADVALVFGLAEQTGARVSGHCWLVKDGHPILERQDPRPVFIETYRIAARPSNVAAAC